MVKYQKIGRNEMVNQDIVFVVLFIDNLIIEIILHIHLSVIFHILFVTNMLLNIYTRLFGCHIFLIF